MTLFGVDDGVARNLGLNLSLARLSNLLLATVMTAGARLTVGPLSFIWLMAPHKARMLGFYKPLVQRLMASAIRGILIMFADWCGRMVMFPNQIPNGLLATLSACQILSGYFADSVSNGRYFNPVRPR